MNVLHVCAVDQATWLWRFRQHGMRECLYTLACTSFVSYRVTVSHKHHVNFFEESAIWINDLCVKCFFLSFFCFNFLVFVCGFVNVFWFDVLRYWCPCWSFFFKVVNMRRYVMYNFLWCTYVGHNSKLILYVFVLPHLTFCVWKLVIMQKCLCK